MDIQAPYDPGQPDPIFVGGDNDAGGTDSVAGDVAGAVANSQARQHEYEADTLAQGSQIGDSMTIPAESSTGTVGGAYYDPPRSY
jgi:hypothetical protein